MKDLPDLGGERGFLCVWALHTGADAGDLQGEDWYGGAGGGLTDHHGHWNINIAINHSVEKPQWFNELFHWELSSFSPID